MHEKFKKKFGQNFIRDKNLLDAIVRDSLINIEDEVLEIGAGEGTLTTAIAKVCNKVVSYEIDNDLKEHLLSLNLKNVIFIFKDALKTPIDEIEKAFKEKYCIVANLPYYITTPLIFKFLEETDRLKSLTIMVQKEVAQRMCASVKDDNYGILSVMMKFYGEAKLTRIVKRNMFYPMPNVDSAIIHLDISKKYDVNKIEFSNFVRGCFAMKRKTLYNNLIKLSYQKNKIEEAFISVNLHTQVRAEELNIDEFIALYNLLK